MELWRITTVFVYLTLTGLAATPHGYGVKGGASAKAEAHAAAGAYAGFPPVPLSIPSGPGYSGSFSKSSSSSFASSSASSSSSSSSFSFSGAGANALNGFGINGGCSGGCPNKGNGDGNSQINNAFENSEGASSTNDATSVADENLIKNPQIPQGATCRGANCPDNNRKPKCESGACLANHSTDDSDEDDDVTNIPKGSATNNGCSSGNCGQENSEESDDIKVNVAGNKYNTNTDTNINNQNPSNACSNGKCKTPLSQYLTPPNNYNSNNGQKITQPSPLTEGPKCSSPDCEANGAPSVPQSPTYFNKNIDNNNPNNDCSNGKCNKPFPQDLTPPNNYNFPSAQTGKQPNVIAEGPKCTSPGCDSYSTPSVPNTPSYFSKNIDNRNPNYDCSNGKCNSPLSQHLSPPHSYNIQNTNQPSSLAGEPKCASPNCNSYNAADSFPHTPVYSGITPASYSNTPNKVPGCTGYNCGSSSPNDSSNHGKLPSSYDVPNSAVLAPTNIPLDKNIDCISGACQSDILGNKPSYPLSSNSFKPGHPQPNTQYNCASGNCAPGSPFSSGNIASSSFSSPSYSQGTYPNAVQSTKLPGSGCEGTQCETINKPAVEKGSSCGASGCGTSSYEDVNANSDSTGQNNNYATASQSNYNQGFLTSPSPKPSSIAPGIPVATDFKHDLVDIPRKPVYNSPHAPNTELQPPTQESNANSGSYGKSPIPSNSYSGFGIPPYNVGFRKDLPNNTPSNGNNFVSNAGGTNINSGHNLATDFTGTTSGTPNAPNNYGTIPNGKPHFSTPGIISSQNSQDKKTPYHGSFGGPSGLLKPNEYTIPKIPSQTTPSLNSPTSCGSSDCGQKAVNSGLNGAQSSLHNAGIVTAGASASAKAVAYSGGFGGPPGFLKPHDDGKSLGFVPLNGKHSLDSHGHDHAGDSTEHKPATVGQNGNDSNYNHANAVAQASAVASAQAGSQGNALDGSKGCNICNGGNESNGGNSLAATKSVASASAGSYGLGNSFSSSSASAHASAGAATKGGYGK